MSPRLESNELKFGEIPSSSFFGAHPARMKFGAVLGGYDGVI